MSEALLDPGAIEAKFIEARRSGPPQVVDGERLQWQIHLARKLMGAVRDPVEGRIRDRTERIVTRREDIF